jgi:hypothetical protein
MRIAVDKKSMLVWKTTSSDLGVGCNRTHPRRRLLFPYVFRKAVRVVRCVRVAFRNFPDSAFQFSGTRRPPGREKRQKRRKTKPNPKTALRLYCIRQPI